MQSNHYDYIITGGGLAGLSLTHYLLQSSLRNKRILIIDNNEKRENDRTWCYWERENSAFDFLVCHRWQHLDFHTPDFSKTLNIHPYEYKMIRSIDFYQYGEEMLISRKNVDKLVENVEKVASFQSKVLVTTSRGEYTADFCFNSILFEKVCKKENLYLAQHFKGQIIRSKNPVFNSEKATLMDFRLPHEGETRFVYVLPTSAHEALIEATLFSPDLLQEQEYDRLIENYIAEYLPEIEDYEVVHNEFGVIPMTDYKFSTGEGRIINIGTAGGHTKASSGYTFYFLQHFLEKTVRQLEETGNPRLKKSLKKRWFDRLDKIFLHVLQHKKVPPPQVFGNLFRYNPPARVLKFMAEETSVAEEMRIMSTMQIFPFFRAMLRTLR